LPSGYVKGPSNIDHRSTRQFNTMKTIPNLDKRTETHPSRSRTSLTLACLLLAPAASVMAQTQWTNTTGDFNNASSWNPNTIPTGTVNCTVDNGATILIQPGDPVFQHGDTLAGNAAGTTGSWLQTGSTNFTGAGPGGNWLRLALGVGSTGSYVLSNGLLYVWGQTHVGEVGTGFMELDGGTYYGVGNPMCMGDGDFGATNNYAVGTLTINGGSHTNNAETWIGEGGNDANRRGTGHFFMHGGYFYAGNWFVLGRFGGAGDGFMDGGTIEKANNGNWQMAVGSMNTNTVGGSATFTQVGGTILCHSEYQISTDNALAVCTNNISGNAVLTVDNWFAVGRFNGYGVLNLSGNAHVKKTSVNGGNVTIGSRASTGIINQNGGTFTNTATQTWICEANPGAGRGYWNMTNGTTVLGVVHLTQNSSGGVGTFNLDGGDLTATEFTDLGTDLGYLNLNGGTLHVGSPVANPWIHNINGGVAIQAGGANIDTAGNNAIISQALLDGTGGGGLTKSGAGTLTLSGVNNYSGPTTINAGSLVSSTMSFVSSAYIVADGAGMGVTLAAANGQHSPTSVTLGTSAATTLSFDVGNFGNPTLAPLNVTGTLTVNGAVTINLADAFPQLGQIPLISYGTKTGSGTFSMGSLPNGVVGTLVNDTVNHLIYLNVTSVAVDEWNGLAGGNWDINVTTNWTSAGNGLPTKYTDGSSVIFNDTVTGTNVVNLVQTVVPGTLTIQNDQTNYSLVGIGRINGAVGLNKQGAASFSITTTNGFTGPVNLAGGTLVANNLANGGSASAIGASSANPTNLNFTGGTLSYTGPAATNNRGYTLNYYYISNAVVLNSTLDLESDLTITGPATAVASASFVKSGPGKLTYAGATTNELNGGTVYPGYDVLSGTLAFDGSAGGTNHNQGEMWIGAGTNSGASLVMNNATLWVDSWLAIARGNGGNGYASSATINNSKLRTGALSLGYDAGITPNVSFSTMTLNNSTYVEAGNFNLAEKAGSTATFIMNGTSVVTMAGPLLPGMQSTATGNVVMANSSIITNNNWISIGANGTGLLVMSNNTLFAENSDFNLGDYGAGGTLGTLNIQDNARIVMTGGGSFFVGKTAGSIGVVNQTGGTIDARRTGVFQLAQQATSSGTWLQSAGTNYAGGWLSIGRGATAGDTSPTGLWVVSGGLLDQSSTGNGLIVGEQGTGTLVVSNTGVVISEASNIGVAIGWNGGLGTFDLNPGGTLVANFIQGGSGNSTFNFGGGLLRAGVAARVNFMTNLTAAFILATSTVDTGPSTIDITTALLDGGSGGGLTKTGTGTLLLDGANTYSGTTTVSAGSLGGHGSLAGPLVIQSGARLSPGASIGTLTVSGSVSLAAGSSTLMEVDKTSMTSDLVTGASSIAYGGSLTIKNLSGKLAANDTFTLFSAGSYSGSFSSIVSETAGQTVTWDTSQLGAGGNGTVRVISATTTPVTLTAGVSGTNYNLSWPASQTGWTLETQANAYGVGLNPTNWTPVPGSTATNQMSFPIDMSKGSVFFRLAF
jgi:autotransporter-associated beta strand protein